jgi:hypothetical protein
MGERGGGRSYSALLAGALAASMVLVVLFTWPIFRHPGYWGIADWDLHFSYHEVPRLTVARYHQFPLWDPFYCGGAPLLANPESRFLSPFFPLHLLLGTVVAVKLEIVLHMFLGLIGAFLLSRRLGLDGIGSALASGVFVFSSMFAVNLSTGDYFAMAAYIPWAFLFCSRGLERPWDRIGGAAILALIFLEGGPYPLVIALFTLGVYALATAAFARSRKPVIGFLLTGILALALGAVKFFPALEFLHEHPREMRDYSGFSVVSLWESLTVRDQRQSVGPEGDDIRGLLKGRSWGIDENGMYIGLIPLALGLAGLLLGGREYRPLRVTFAAVVWMMFGRRIYPSLWDLAHRFPIYSSIRVAQRFRMASLLIFSIFCGIGLEKFREGVRSRAPRRGWAEAAAAVLITLVLVDLWLVDRPIWSEAFIVPPMATTRRETFSQLRGRRSYDETGFTQLPTAHATGSSHYPSILSNEGLIDCYTPLKIPRRAVSRDAADYKGEVSLDGTTGRAEYAAWTPNRLEIDVRADGPGYLVVNQNHSPHWSSADGRAVLQRGGLLAVPISSGDSRIELVYRPLSFVIGAAVSLLTLFGVGAWALGAGMRRRP